MALLMREPPLLPLTRTSRLRIFCGYYRIFSDIASTSKVQLVSIFNQLNW